MNGLPKNLKKLAEVTLPFIDLHLNVLDENQRTAEEDNNPNNKCR